MKAQRIVQHLTICIFLLFLSVPLWMFIITPERSFSDLENRYLSKMPSLSNTSIWDTSFQKKSEDAFNDQFLFRDSLVSLNTFQDYAMGYSSIHDVYFGKDSYLLNQQQRLDESIWKQNVKALNIFALDKDIPMYLMLVPSTRTILENKLPNPHYDIDEDVIVKDIQSSLTKQMNYVDVFQTLRNHSLEDIYYKSDHHWSALGSYYGYIAFQKERHQEPTPLGTKELIKSNFLGSLYARSKASWYPGDTLYAYKNLVDVQATYDGLQRDTLYIDENAKKRDAYTYFMDGNHAEVNVTTTSTKKEHILIVRDSYAQSFAPYLANDVSQITLLDLRYYKGNISEYIQEHQVDEVLFLYSMDTFMNTRDISTLK